MGKLKVELSTLDEDGDKISEDRERLVVTYDGKEILSQYCGEPEDNTFNRDWNFLPDFIEKIYNLGLKDGGGEQEKQAA